MARKRDILGAIDRLAQQERAFFGGDVRFLAPVLPGRKVRVRIAGVVCTMAVEPVDFVGWGVFEPVTHNDALLERIATLAERRRYLDLLPAVRLILVGPDTGEDARRCGRWLAMPAGADSRFSFAGPGPVLLGPEEADPLDTIIARFDGAAFWFDEPDPAASPAEAAYLRQAAVDDLPPASLNRKGLSAAQRAAYALFHEAARHRRGVAEHLAELAEAARRQEAARQQAARAQVRARRRQATDEQRIREALEHGGAELREMARRGGEIRVTYEVDGRRHVSLVHGSDLTVQSAGVCLSGGDRAFDLASLVGVLREGYGGGADHW